MTSDDTSASSSSRTAALAGWLGLAGPGLACVGLLIVRLGAPALAGFALLQLGLLAALVAIITGGIGIALTRGGVGGRPKALQGLALGVLLLGIIAVGAGSGLGVPPINDIATDLESPPGYAMARAGHANEGRDMSYPADFVAQVRAAYADLSPIRVALGSTAAYELALQQAESLGWEITRRDPTSTSFEAEAVTALWQFVDDVSVRVRADGPDRSIIDMRSKSRDGRGDLGANANRIRAFASAIGGASTGVAASPTP